LPELGLIISGESCGSAGMVRQDHLLPPHPKKPGKPLGQVPHGTAINLLKGEIGNTLKDGLGYEALYLMQGGDLGDFGFGSRGFQGGENARQGWRLPGTWIRVKEFIPGEKNLNPVKW
jgi:hypothetical protein